MFPLDFSNYKTIPLTFDKKFVTSNCVNLYDCSSVLHTFTFAVSTYIVSLEDESWELLNPFFTDETQE